MRAIIGVIALFLFLTASLGANAAPNDPIGSTTVVINEVRAEFEDDNRSLETGDAVHQNELIAVGEESTSEIILDDDTKLALGAGSRLLLDKFVYNGVEKSEGSIVLDLVLGTFRFVTGVAKKSSYRIQTPSAAITVRGTIFDVFVSEIDEIWMLLLEGGLDTCTDAGDCRQLDEPGMLIRVTKDGQIDGPMRWADLKDRKGVSFGQAFPFVVKPPRLDHAPVPSVYEIVDRVPRKNPPQREVTPDLPEEEDAYCPPPRYENANGICTCGPRRTYNASRNRCDRISSGPEVICRGGGTPVRTSANGLWVCACPEGKIAKKIGKKTYRCVSTYNPAKDCRDKGWIWTGKKCIPPVPKVCPPGYIGKPPFCKKLPKKCPKGYIGKPPFCKKLPKKCPKGYIGKPPFCKKLPKKCPKGYIGKPPFCKKLPKKCPKGYIGKPPFCKKLPKKCKKGYIGKPPFCKKLPKKCKKGYIGKPPFCKKLPKKCKKGYIGKPPFCKKIVLKKPKLKLKLKPKFKFKKKKKWKLH